MYIFVIYFIVRFFTRLLLPVVMEDYLKNAKKRAEREKHEFYKAEKKREGKISIDFGPNKGRNDRNEEGEYVDYEEIK